MSKVKITVHVVWNTKNRAPVLVKNLREILFSHIVYNSVQKGIYIDCIDGYTNHIHCLISLGTEQNIAKVLQLLKGESSYWANKIGLFPNKLDWGEDYFASSVSLSKIDIVRNYILNQEIHHKKITFEDECVKLFKVQLS